VNVRATLYRVKIEGMTKKRFPADVLAYFRQMGAKGGRIGGKRSLETMTAAERRACAKKASLAAVARRAKSKGRREPASRRGDSNFRARISG
jgi:hypothetical protein